ncbi:MAG TPA: DegT/DnrJ/EryC1/StrS aminotransferase family protein [Dongiaceae bacterium]|nr:DegT/DnrJ/EryC1/StrS aminotransferase family protein [Dongiaceae bacterium]
MSPAAALAAVPARPIVPHARPSLGPDEEAAALRVLRSGRLAPGAEAARLEALVARLSGGADAVAVGSGTLALTLALKAVGVAPGQEVAVPAYGCAALLHGVRAAGAVPLIADIDPGTLAIDPADLARRAGARLAAVVAVHPFGEAIAIEPYRSFGVPIIEDAAQSPGAMRDGRPVGARGDAAVFSFAPTKLITCGGPGGAVAAPSGAPVRAARDLARHDENADDRPRLNGLMGDLHAAIAATQIGRLPEIVARRRTVIRRYDQAFEGLSCMRRRPEPGTTPVPWRYLLAVRDRAAELVAALQARGVFARAPVWRPLHLLVPGTAPCPGADQAHAALVSLPLSASFGEAEIRQVIHAVRACLS